jgi:UDP-glucuronate decarboxylase
LINRIILEDLDFIHQKSIHWRRFKNKTVLITGAYGMLASFIVRMLMYLNEIDPLYNIKVIGLVRNLDKAYKKYPDYINCKKFKLIESDVCIPLKLTEKVDFIIHAASPASSQYYGTNPVGTLMPNVIGTYHLLEYAKEQKVEGFLYFSSGEVYGEFSSDKSLAEIDCGYLNPVALRSCYGESKRMGENMCKAWQHQYGVPTKIARIAHTYGPTMELEGDSRVFSEFVSDVVNNHDIVMKSAGNAYRQFCYISDATVAFFKILLEGEPGEAYNVGNDKGVISISDLAELLVEMFPEKRLKVIKIKRRNDGAYLESVASNVITLDISKLKALGWRPMYSIEAGFRRTIESFELSNVHKHRKDIF